MSLPDLDYGVDPTPDDVRRAVHVLTWYSAGPQTFDVVIVQVCETAAIILERDIERMEEREKR